MLSKQFRKAWPAIVTPEFVEHQREFLEEMTPDPAAFACSSFEVGAPAPTLEWKRVRHAEDRPWPPPGAALTFRCASPDPALAGVEVGVHYELYDGLPLTCKWLTLINGTDRPVRVDGFTADILAAVAEKTGTLDALGESLELVTTSTEAVDPMARS